jgi:hypothetical protein
MEKFNLKKLNDMEVKNSIRLKPQIALQLWKTRIIMVKAIITWTSVGLRKVLEYESFSHRESRLL